MYTLHVHTHANAHHSYVTLCAWRREELTPTPSPVWGIFCSMKHNMRCLDESESRSTTSTFGLGTGQQRGYRGTTRWPLNSLSWPGHNCLAFIIAFAIWNESHSGSSSYPCPWGHCASDFGPRRNKCIREWLTYSGLDILKWRISFHDPAALHPSAP